MSTGTVIYNVGTNLIGEIKDINNQVIGTVDNEGLIYDGAQNQIAHFSSANKLITIQGMNIGKINIDGSIQNQNGVVIGYIKNGGKVVNSKGRLIIIGGGISNRILVDLCFFYPL
ncbi:MAG: hypothetical protein HRT73_16700 [Flavobacteriales bacterium]|nr:hypothetical protein [Flavobacteriales bacterium]